MPFETDLVVRAIDGGRWALEKPLIYRYLMGAKSVRFVVPKGFTTDLASIPAALTPLLPVNDSHRPAAVLHDYLYQQQGLERSLVDAIFRRAMADCAVSWWKRWIIWAGVRAGGWVAWDEHARENAKGGGDL